MIVKFAMLLDNISPFGTTWRQEGLFSETNAKVRITSLKKNTIDSFVKLSYKNTHTPVSVSVCVGNWIGVFIHRLLTIFPQMPSQTLCSNWSTDCFLSHHDTFILSASVFHLCPLSICPGNWAELRRDDTNRKVGAGVSEWVILSEGPWTETVQSGTLLLPRSHTGFKCKKQVWILTLWQF